MSVRRERVQILGTPLPNIKRLRSFSLIIPNHGSLNIPLRIAKKDLKSNFVKATHIKPISVQNIFSVTQKMYSHFMFYPVRFPKGFNPHKLEKTSQVNKYIYKNKLKCKKTSLHPV